MAEGDATLVAWALGTDVLWITKGPRGFIQKSAPAPGESFGWFQRELVRMMTNYVDLRKVADYWQKKGVDDKRIRKIAIGNYARALQDAFRLRQVEKAA
jgi:microsomal dipeptidase-like Zn-dependent dipeptidase